MKLQFDASQQYQLDAIASVVELFQGQPQGPPEFSVIKAGEFGSLFAGQEQTELGVGNRILLGEEKLRENARAIQLRNEIDITDTSAGLEGWELFDGPANRLRACPHFSVEMETGTGKTYVYLRTILELSRRYGFQKFAIVVPSVAIREGVLKSLEITADHFRSIYNNLSMEPFVYDGKRASRLRQFAVSNTLQILVINIDAFRKNFTGTEDERKSNVIYQDRDSANGRAWIEYVQAARPIVIVDEPQSVDSTDRAQEAMKALNPLCTLRYSATHRNPYNLVYRLDPVRAFELKLVKQIFVAGTSAEGGANDPFIRVEKIDYRDGIKAKVRIHVNAPGGPKEKSITLKSGYDLFAMSNEREAYRNFSVAEINAEPGNERLRFNNGRSLGLGEQLGGLRDSVWLSQIRTTVAKHLEKELQVRERGIKVLSLFFIDRVAHYRDYDAAGQPVKGKFAAAFEEALAALGREERFKGLEWLRLPVERLHDGYFAQDRSGVLKDTRGDTQADDEVYNLIMKDKERLLSAEEPLRFIFSHSALREGWDSPNVFQICTLNETKSTIKKRQEIGRGLRLPVDQTGQRVFDESINRLHVIANESYEDFAKALQTEYEEDCGVTFGKVPIRALARMARVVDGVEKPIGPEIAETIRTSLVAQKMLDAEGRILSAFEPARPDFKLELPEGSADLALQVIDLLSQYRMERLIRRDKSELKNRLNKERVLEPEFQALWDRIKPKTTYRVEFKTEQLVALAVAALKRMQLIEAPKVRVSTGRLDVTHGGVATAAMSVTESQAPWGMGPLPDILAYLQNETELTRSTLARILKASGRLAEFFVDPQRFMDAVAGILKYELHRLLVDGIKYERLAGANADWEMALFENEELVNYLSSLKVDHSIYDYVTYDSEVEREFARKLDQRGDIKLFVKLPSWFLVETPVGKYNPDWAVVKHDSETVYLVKETKGNKDFLKLRTSEADKVRCGKKHFDALGVSFAVVVSADEV